MLCVMDIFNRLCGMSGQEVSLGKTNILFSKNVDRRLCNKLVRISGFKETNDLCKYLGRALEIIEFQFLIDQVRDKLTTWKENQLSFAGRVTLAKSNLNPKLQKDVISMEIVGLL